MATIGPDPDFHGSIDDKFVELMQSNVGVAVIMAGSGSDQEHVSKITGDLERYGVPFRTHVCSAHKQPGQLAELIDEYDRAGGLVAYVAVAGGTDVLSGTLSWAADGIVISCPPEASKKVVNDSCLKNPPGSSNVYIMRPGNAARAVVQAFAGINPAYKEALEKEREGKLTSLEVDDKKLHDLFSYDGGAE